MPNYSLILDTKFKPFSYQEMLAPVAAATQAHQALEADLSNLQAMAGVWEKLAGDEKDREVYSQYRKYYDDVESEVNSLMRYGLTPQARKGLMTMRSRYQKEISPIEEAYKKREAEIARQQSISDKSGGNTLFTRDARTTSLSDYMNGISDFGQINLDKVMQEGMAAGKALSSRYISNEMSQKFGPAYDVLTKQKGLSPKEAILALSGGKGYEDFTNFITQSLEKYNSTAYGNNADKIEKALLSGMDIGIMYDVTDSLNRNAEYEQNLKLKSEMALERYKKSLNDPPPGYDYTRLHHTDALADLKGVNGRDYAQLFTSQSTKGSGMNTSYFGGKTSKDGKTRKFVNPMKVYEEYKELLKKNLQKSGIDPYMASMPAGAKQAQTERFSLAEGNTIAAIRAKYGVDKVLTPTQYKLMQDMGYSNDSKFSDFGSNEHSRRFDSLQETYLPTSLSLSNYDIVGKDIIKNLSQLEKSDPDGKYLWDITTGESVSLSDVIKRNKNTDAPISTVDDINYSIREKDKAIVYIDGRAYYMNLSQISPDVAGMVKSLYGSYNDLSPEEKSYMQDNIALAIQKKVTDWKPVPPSTTKGA